MRTLPKWATPDRRAWLAYRLATFIANDTGGFEIDLLTGKVVHPGYEDLEAMLREEWVADDRDERAYLQKLESYKLHPKEIIRQGGFDSIAREVFNEHKPSYYLEGMAVDVLRGKRVARVRVASSPIRLWVDIPSKNARRKAKRYGSPGPKNINEALTQAVNDYLKHH